MVSMGSACRASFFDSAQENGILTESHELLGPASVPISLGHGTLVHYEQARVLQHARPRESCRRRTKCIPRRKCLHEEHGRSLGGDMFIQVSWGYCKIKPCRETMRYDNARVIDAQPYAST